MTLYVFKCTSLKNRTGLTIDKTGANLPADLCKNGRWGFWKTIEINEGDPARIGVGSTEEILAAIEEKGYYINDTSITFTEQ